MSGTWQPAKKYNYTIRHTHIWQLKGLGKTHSKGIGFSAFPLVMFVFSVPPRPVPCNDVVYRLDVVDNHVSSGMPLSNLTQVCLSDSKRYMTCQNTVMAKHMLIHLHVHVHV